MQTPAQQLRALGAPFTDVFADSIEKGESEAASRCRREAAQPDSYFDREPMPGTFGIVGLIRHATIRTGFSAEWLEQLVQVRKPGTFAAILAGTNSNIGYLGGFHPRPLVDFVNVSRYIRAADPDADLEAWWTEKRHGKRLSPIELIGRVQDPIFDPYRDELTVQPHSQILGNAVFVDIPLFYLGPGGLGID